MANAAPGISGGTIAVIFGVYEDMLVLPSLDFKFFKERRKEIYPLLLGMACGILLFARLIDLIYKIYPVYADFFFMGIITGSLAFIYQLTKESDGRIKTETKPLMLSFKNKEVRKHLIKASIKLFWFLLGISVMLLMSIYKGKETSPAAEQILSVRLFIKLFAVCAAASAAMIVPGISGAFMLLIFGAYKTVMQAAAEFNTALLFPIAAGCAAGLIAASRAVKYLLKKFRVFTYSFILGLTVGSLFNLMPSACLPLRQRIIAISIAITGYIIITIITLNDKKGEKNEQV